MLPSSQRLSVFGAHPMRSAACSNVQDLRARAATNFVRFIASVLAYDWPLAYETLANIQFSAHSITWDFPFVELAVEKRRTTLCDVVPEYTCIKS